MKALGMIEVEGYLAAVEALDTALKAANVHTCKVSLVTGGLVSVFVSGDVGAVKAAIDSAAAAAERVGNGGGQRLHFELRHREFRLRFVGNGVVHRAAGEGGDAAGGIFLEKIHQKRHRVAMVAVDVGAGVAALEPAERQSEPGGVAGQGFVLGGEAEADGLAARTADAENAFVFGIEVQQ